jgi:[ribosomal protein S5]-alanine N-acetyltransferase
MDQPKQEPVVFLRGQRLYLRPSEMADAPRWQRWINDPEIRASIDRYLPLTETRQRELLSHAGEKPDEVDFAIVLNDGDLHIGGVGLHRIRWKDRAGEFGIVIGSPECRGRGYGTEATRLTLRYAFETLNLNRVELGVFAFNAAAIRVYEKLGFILEGVLREERFINGRYVDAPVYSILAREYFAQAK